METTWCDRMEAAAEGHTPNVCDGRATVRVEYAQQGHGGGLVAYVCDSCGQAMVANPLVCVFATRRMVTA